MRLFLSFIVFSAKTSTWECKITKSGAANWLDFISIEQKLTQIKAQNCKIFQIFYILGRCVTTSVHESIQKDQGRTKKVLKAF